MCLVTTQSCSKFVCEPIGCWKVMGVGVNGDLFSMVMMKSYEVGEEYYESGFVTCQAKGGEYLGCRIGYEDEYYLISKGFHSYTSFENAKRVNKKMRDLGYGTYIIRCEIPAGAFYYTNFCGEEYCSNRIKIVEIMEEY